MPEIDPILHVEKIVKEVHDSASKFSRPVLKRYPLIFAFLIVFSIAAILHGFELATDKMQIFVEHPNYLILIGVIALFITGKLYQSLEKMK